MDQVQQCPRCGQGKTVDGYHPDKWGKAGHYCRECVVEYKREWKRRHAVAAGRPGVQGCDLPPGWRMSTSRRAMPPPSGDPISYHGAHKALMRSRGRAATHPCVGCGGKADEWSYDHADVNELHGLNSRNQLRAYSLDPAHYHPRCYPCHRAFDTERDDRTVSSTLTVTSW